MPLLTTGAGAYQAGAAPSFTTLDPANTFNDFTLSGGNLIATFNNGTIGFSRSIASHSSGSYFFSGTMSAAGGSNAFGVQDGSQGHAGANFLGDSVHSIGWYPSGSVFFNNASIGAAVSYVASDVLDVALNIGTSKVWFRKNGGNWNNDILANQNPATSAGGFSISGISTPVFASIEADFGPVTAVTVNFGATAYTNAAPVGYGNW